jgi:hypothetical protein
MRPILQVVAAAAAAFFMATSPAATRTLRAQEPLHADTVAPGIVHLELTRPEGPWRVQVVRVELRGGRYRVLVRHATADTGRIAGLHATLAGRERTSALAARLTAAGDTVLAAINGDFFDLATGENENDQVVDGRLLKGVPVTDSPFDTFRNPHTQFAVDAGGRPYIDRFAFRGALDVAGVRAAATRNPPRGFVLDGLNGIPRGRDGLVLFTAEHGAMPLLRTARQGAPRPRDPDAPSGPPRTTATDSASPAVEVELQVVTGAAPRYRVAGAPRPLAASSQDTIEASSARLVAYGAARPRLDSIIARAGVLIPRFSLVPERGRLAQLVGGWPRLVVDGQSVAAGADGAEGTFPSFSAKRHARSALAISRDSATLFLVVVDGLTPGTTGGPSVGMTLVEFADQLLALGAWQAMNLDGGGSSTLLAGGKVVNRPSDPTGERAVGNALLVVRRR